MSQYKRPESVLVVVYTRTGSVLLLKRADVAEFWQSVTGAMQWDETAPRMAAARELKEETGLHASPDALRDLGLAQHFPIFTSFRHRYAPDVTENLEHAFAFELDAEIALPGPLTEHVEYNWFSFAHAQRKATSWTDCDAIRAAFA